MSKKDDLPAMPFYIGDWAKAPEVKALPLDTRMVWMEMLFIMWESRERGYLTIAGKPIISEVLCNMIPGVKSHKEMLSHLKKMEHFEVYKRRDHDGAIYSPNMVKKEEVRRKKQTAGRMGGNPGLLNQEDNQQDNQGSEQSEQPSGLTKRETETEYKNKKKIELKKQRKRFENIWSRGVFVKTGKKEAFRHFQTSVKDIKDWRDINIAHDKYKRHLELNDWKRPQTGKVWFNNWHDWVDFQEPDDSDAKERERLEKIKKLEQEVKEGKDNA